MRKTRTTLAIVLALILVMSLSISAFAVTAADAAGAKKVDSTVAVMLTEGQTDASGATITNNSTYKAVKIADLYKMGVANDGKNVYQYVQVLDPTLAADAGFLQILDQNGFAYDEATGAITLKAGGDIATEPFDNNNTSDASKLAAAIAHYVVDKNGVTMTAGTAADLECGYWVIFETAKGSDNTLVSTKPVLVELTPEDEATGVNVTLKDAKVDLNKTVNNQEEDTVSVGDTVNYKVATNFPEYENTAANATYNVQFKVEDTLDAGLDFVSPLNVVVKVAGAEVAQTGDGAACTVTQDGRKLTVEFKPATIMAYKGAAVEITYSAKVNGNAVVNKAGGNANDVKVTYSNNPEVSNSVKTLEDKAPVYTYAFDVNKIDGSTGNDLAGAKFEMKNGTQTMYFIKDGDTYTYDSTITAPTDGYTAEIVAGNVVIKGLDEGTYKLHETEAPNNTYALLGEDVSVTITGNKTGDALNGSANVAVSGAGAKVNTDAVATEAANADTGVAGESDVNVIVRNYKGISLPETGSMTSIIVMVVGALIVLGGGAYLVLSRKKVQSK